MLYEISNILLIDFHIVGGLWWPFWPGQTLHDNGSHRWLSSYSTDWAQPGPLLEGEYSKMSKGNRLAIPAVRQIMAKLAKGEKEEEETVEKIEDSCLRFDHDKKGVRSNWL